MSGGNDHKMGWILLSCSPVKFLSANFNFLMDDQMRSDQMMSDIYKTDDQMNSPGEWRGAWEVATPITACVPRCFAGHVNSDHWALIIEKFWSSDHSHNNAFQVVWLDVATHNTVIARHSLVCYPLCNSRWVFWWRTDGRTGRRTDKRILGLGWC